MRTALVTGGSRGIGRAIAERLAARGDRVAVNYASNAAAAEEVVETITDKGGEAIAVQADVGDESSVRDLFDEVTSTLGPVEILVNNAGITRDGLLVTMSPADWDEVLRVDLRSAFLCTRQAMRQMIRARWGRVVSIGSVAGVAGNPGQANYAAAKAGLIGFTKAVAKEIGSRGITVNVVAPGYIETELTDVLDDRIKERAEAAISLGRFGRVDEVAAAVEYLASDAASYITGQTLVVDGGVIM